MLARNEKKKVPILMYHSISQYAKRRFKQFVVSPALFADHMAYLHRHSYTPITVSQFVRDRAQEKTALPKRPVVLTFDDGFADFFTEVLPVLQRYSFPATLYVPTMFINGTSRWLQMEGEGTRPMITWEQLSEIAASGIECGSHSHSHPQLDVLPPHVARNEIVLSKELLEQHLGREVVSFAYPFGYHTASVRRQVKEAGYASACAVKFEMCSESTDHFALTRFIVKSETCTDTFAALLSGRSASTATTLYMQARTPVWQMVRRSSTWVTLFIQERLPLR